MCRFVALIAKEDTNLKPYFEFLKKQAKSGKRSPHPDGFGYWILSKKGEYYYRTTLPAWDVDVKLPSGHIAFFHARRRGKEGAPVNILNVHPFIHEDAIFMHNGVIKIDKHPKSVGNTDTESFFRTLLDMGIENGLKHLETCEYVSMNFVMCKQDKIYIFRAAKKLPDYFTLFLKKDKNKVIVSTENNDDEWKEVKNGEMIIISKDLNIYSICIFPDMCH